MYYRNTKIRSSEKRLNKCLECLLCEGEKDYYERQFATLKSFEKVDLVVEADEIEEEDLDEQRQQERAMRISNYANILLLALKVTRCSLCLFHSGLFKVLSLGSLGHEI